MGKSIKLKFGSVIYPEKYIKKAMLHIRNELHLSSYQLEGVQKYLEYLYTIGYEAGRANDQSKQSRPVLKFYNGLQVQRYPSTAHAARAAKVDPKTMREYLQKPIRGIGIEWKYESNK